MTIKPYARFSLLAIAFLLCLNLAACSTAWTTEATNIISVLEPAVIAALGILSAFGIGISPSALTAVQKWGTQAQTALAEVKTLITEYNTAEATAQPGILTEIQTLLSTISSNLAELLPTLHVTNASTQAKIMAVFDAVASEISALIALVPALQGKVTSHDELKKLMAAVKSKNEFKAFFNKQVDAFGPTAKTYELK